MNSQSRDEERRGDSAANPLTPRAISELMPLIYSELRALAAAQLRRERPGHTLQPTALVHEAFLRLAAQTRAEFRDREHFFAVAAEAIRRVLVDHARARQADKRQAAGQRLTIHAALDAAEAIGGGELNLLGLDDALTRLAALNERQSKVVELRFFGGLSIEETARALEVSEGTVKGDWRLARAWLERELAAQEQA
ncbi:MAG: ECF-type sigma factor [Phycisphaerae bacterium]